MPRSVYSGSSRPPSNFLSVFLHRQNSIYLLNIRLCRSSWESYELLFFRCKRLFSQLVSVLLRLLSLCSCATSHSFPVGLDGGCYYPPTMPLVPLFFLSPSFWWRLSTTNCIWMWAWSRKRRARKRKGKKRNKHTQHNCSLTTRRRRRIKLCASTTITDYVRVLFTRTRPVKIFFFFLV